MKKRILCLLHNEGGFSMVVVVGIMAVISIIGASLIYVANQDVHDVKRENLAVTAMNAAEAGVNAYLWKVNDNTDYFKTTSDPAELDWVALQDGEYRLSVAVQNGRPGVTVTSTGRILNQATSPPSYVQKQIKARIEKRSFTQYTWVTNYETLEDAHKTPIYFVTGDVIDGPVHSNDVINLLGNPGPIFEGPVSTAKTFYLRYSDSTATFNGGSFTHAPPLELPTSNQKLKEWAQQANGYYYFGETSITLLPNGQMKVGNNDYRSTGATGTAVSLPVNGVLYVDGQTADKWTAANGDCYIEGTLKGQLTVAAKNNIYITGDITYSDISSSSSDILGLVAENYVYINHYGRNDVHVAQDNISIRAAIFALNHSYGVERYDEPKWKPHNNVPQQENMITIVGAIAQRYRGPVGTVNQSGYKVKNYHYDQRMQYMEPPHFIEPLNAGFQVTDWRETKNF